MVSTVTTRPSHYEILGLAPFASSDEIARAFAREMGRPRAFGALAEISIAYETLRDPERRRAYDRTLGLEPKPAPLLSSSGVGGAAFLARPALLAERAQAPAAVEPGPRPSIAAALHELARPEPLVAPPKPAPPPPPARERVQLTLDDGTDADAAGAIPWRPVAIAAGGVALAVALLGAWAGWDSAEPAQARAATRVALPPTTFTVDDPAATRALGDSRAPEPKRAAPAASRVARARPKPRVAEAAAAPPADPLAPIAETAQPTAATAAAPAAAEASLPLPKAVIARTIGRIGYPCGAVASASAADAPGVFTVTCTSGHSYRAAPVHGRYRFRRLAGR